MDGRKHMIMLYQTTIEWHMQRYNKHIGEPLGEKTNIGPVIKFWRCFDGVF